MGERREGVLVRVLVCVLVLVLVLVELSPQVGRRAQGGPAVSTLRGQETCVQFLSQDVLLWKRWNGEGDTFSPNRTSEYLIREGSGPRAQEMGLPGVRLGP